MDAPQPGVLNVNRLRRFVAEQWKASPILTWIGFGLFILPLSNAVGQIPFYLASLAWVISFCRTRTLPVRVREAILPLGYVVICVVSVFYSVRPEESADKLSRFLLLAIAFAIPSEIRKWGPPLRGIRILALSFCAGVSLNGLKDLFRFPLSLMRSPELADSATVTDSGVQATESSLLERLYDLGSMTDPQFYAAGILLFLSFGFLKKDFRIPAPIQGLVLFLMTSGLLLHNKRGSWIACMLAFGLWVVINRRWKIFTIACVVALISLSVPSVRQRLVDLKDVISHTHGGRSVLWREVAPGILPEYPFGMGYLASRYEDFKPYATSHMEEGLGHLHNNILQIRLDVGWHGITWWLIWMGWMGVRAVQVVCHARTPDERVARSGLLVCYAAFHLNGIVEFNFGDGEVLMFLWVLMGCIWSFFPYQPQVASAPLS